jgi:hypothetical protein
MAHLTRVRCPLCGHRLSSPNQLAYPTIRLGNDDVLVQSFGGRGHARTLARYSFDSVEGRPYGLFFLKKIRIVERMLAKMLGDLNLSINFLSGLASLKRETRVRSSRYWNLVGGAL